MSHHYVDISDIENTKENCRPCKSGRSSKSFENLPKLADVLQGERSIHEAQISDPQMSEDLNTWLRYIKWTQENYTTCGKSSQLLNLLERCVLKLSQNSRYKNEFNFLQVWLQYVEFVSEPIDVFKYMESNGIGLNYANFWKSYGQALEQRNRFDEALLVFEKGLNWGAKPEEKMKAYKIEFESRMFTRLMKSQKLSLGAVDSAVNDENEKPRHVLGDLQGVISSTREYGRSMPLSSNINSSSTGRLKSAKTSEKTFVPYEDTEEPIVACFQKDLDAGSFKWKDVPLQSQSVSENQDLSSRWSNWSLPQDSHAKSISNKMLSRQGDSKPFEVFSDACYQAEPIRKKNKFNRSNYESTCDFETPNGIRGSTEVCEVSKSDCNTDFVYTSVVHPYNFTVEYVHYARGNNDLTRMSNSKWETAVYDRSTVYPGDGKEYSFEELRVKCAKKSLATIKTLRDTPSVDKSTASVNSLPILAHEQHTDRQGNDKRTVSSIQLQYTNNCLSPCEQQVFNHADSKQIDDALGITVEDKSFSGLSLVNSPLTEINQSENDLNETTTQTVNSLTVHTKEALATVLNLFSMSDLKSFGDAETTSNYNNLADNSKYEQVTTTLVVPLESNLLDAGTFSVYEDNNVVEEHNGELSPGETTIALKRILDDKNTMENIDTIVGQDDTLAITQMYSEFDKKCADFDQTLNVTKIYRELNGCAHSGNTSFSIDRQHQYVETLPLDLSAQIGNLTNLTSHEIIEAACKHIDINCSLLDDSVNGFGVKIIDCRRLSRPDMTANTIDLQGHKFTVLRVLRGSESEEWFQLQNYNGNKFWCRFGSIYEIYIFNRIFGKLKRYSSASDSLDFFAKISMAFLLEEHCALLMFEYECDLIPLAHFKDLRSASAHNALIDESVCLYILLQLCSIYGVLHELGFTCCGLASWLDYWMVSSSSKEKEDTVGISSVKAPTFGRGMVVMNYSKIVDMELFRRPIVISNLPSVDDSAVVEGEPWASDAWCVLRMLHRLLHNRKLAIIVNQNDPTLKIECRVPFKVFWNVDLLRPIFESILNTNVNLSVTQSSQLMNCIELELKEHFDSNVASSRAVMMQVAKIGGTF